MRCLAQMERAGTYSKASGCAANISLFCNRDSNRNFAN
jgi:hypothetical protein